MQGLYFAYDVILQSHHIHYSYCRVTLYGKLQFDRIFRYFLSHHSGFPPRQAKAGRGGQGLSSYEQPDGGQADVELLVLQAKATSYFHHNLEAGARHCR